MPIPKLAAIAISMAVSAAMTAAQIAIQMLTQKPQERGKFEGKLNVQDSSVGIPISIVYGGEYVPSPSYCSPRDLLVEEEDGKLKIKWQADVDDATIKQVSWVLTSADSGGAIIGTGYQPYQSADEPFADVASDPAPARWVITWIRVRLGYPLAGGGTLYRELKSEVIWRDDGTGGDIATFVPGAPEWW